MIGVAISRFKIDPMLSTKGSKAPGSFMDSRLCEQTVEPARQSSYTRAAEQLKPLAVHANWSLDVLRFPPACCCKGNKALA